MHGNDCPDVVQGGTTPAAARARASQAQATAHQLVPQQTHGKATWRCPPVMLDLTAAPTSRS